MIPGQQFKKDPQIKNQNNEQYMHQGQGINALQQNNGNNKHISNMNNYSINPLSNKAFDHQINTNHPQTDKVMNRKAESLTSLYFPSALNQQSVEQNRKSYSQFLQQQIQDKQYTQQQELQKQREQFNQNCSQESPFDANRKRHLEKVFSRNNSNGKQEANDRQIALQLITPQKKNNSFDHNPFKPHQNQNFQQPPNQFYPNQQQQNQMMSQNPFTANQNNKKIYTFDRAAQNIINQMKILDKKKELRTQKQYDGNPQDKEQQFYGGIYSSIYDINYNNGLRNEKTLLRKQMYAQQKQQQEPLQPVIIPNESEDINALKLRQYQKELEEQMARRRRQLEELENQRRRELERQQQLAEQERQRQHELELQRLQDQIEDERRRRELQQREQSQQQEMETEEEEEYVDREQEEQDALDRALEEERMRLEELQNQLERDKRDMALNADMYQKMMKEMNNNVISAKNQVQDNQQHLHSLLIQMRNEQLKNEEERQLAQERINGLRAYQKNKELDEKIRMNALSQALNKTALITDVQLKNQYPDLDFELNYDPLSNVGHSIPQKSQFIGISAYADGLEQKQKIIEYDPNNLDYTSHVTQLAHLRENQNNDPFGFNQPINQVTSLDLDAINAKNTSILNNLKVMEIQQGMINDPLEELNDASASNNFF